MVENSSRKAVPRDGDNEGEKEMKRDLGEKLDDFQGEAQKEDFHNSKQRSSTTVGAVCICACLSGTDSPSRVSQ